MSFLFQVSFEVHLPEPQTKFVTVGNSTFLNSRASYNGPPTTPWERTVYGYATWADRYRKGPRSVLVLAASQHPADLLVPLGNNVGLQAGEQIQIISVAPVQLGTEGAAPLGAAAAAVFVADFQVRKLNPAPLPLGGAPVNLFTKPPRKALVAAATSAAVSAVLNVNIALASGEVLDLLGAQQYVEGSEGGVVWT